MSYNPEEKIGKIEKTSGPSSEIKVSEPSADEVSVSKTKFDSALDKAEPSSPAAPIQSQQTTAATPVAETNKTEQVGPITSDTIVEKAEGLRKKIDVQKSTLEQFTQQYPQAQLPAAYDTPLSDHLTHVNSSLNSTLNLAGVEAKGIAATPAVGPAQSPMKRFLGYLTNSDQKLGSLIGDMQAAKFGNKPITPAVLMAVQIKLGFIQQEIEFFSNTLNKALESMKTIMNVQV
jgi:hypothetical protein